MMELCLEPRVEKAERIALCTLRRAVSAEPLWGEMAVCPFGIGRDLHRVRSLFLDAWDGSLHLCRQSLSLRNGAGQGVSKNERRLLKAMGAAQDDDLWLLDNYLYKFALEPLRRQRLAGAVESLAASLAVNGYWLPCPEAESFPVPASALRVAYTHGRDLGRVQIAWP